jgi:hypothetical protein
MILHGRDGIPQGVHVIPTATQTCPSTPARCENGDQL